MPDYSRYSDPDFNPHFRRRWTDEPDRALGLPLLNQDATPEVVQAVGRQAIASWLATAGEKTGRQASDAFRRADSIRRRLGLDWADVIGERGAAT